MSKPETDEAGHVLPLQQPNIFKVPPSMWRKWPDISQRVFNLTYERIKGAQNVFHHPRAEHLPAQHWDTVAWNAAFTAAEAVRKALKDIEAGEGYLKA